MKIAQVAPLFESVPPKLYGGTERAVAYLTEELVAQGHDVTLFASGDSCTSARLIPGTPTALRLAECKDSLPHHICMIEDVFRRSHEFDVIHYHIDHVHLPIAARQGIPYLTTLHGRLDSPDLVPLFQTFYDAPMVSISDSQRQPLSAANWTGTVYHGLPRQLLHCHPDPGSYLAFVGRFSRDKGPDRAIEIARRSGLPIKIAAKVDPNEVSYYHNDVEPLFEDPMVEFVGEINERQKDEFLGGALALLFPIEWPEPFGLAMIEAMACGTPVIAFGHGSVPEIMKDGVSGFVVSNVDEAVAAVAKIPKLSRRGCRQYFESRFTADRMAHDYVEIYRALIENNAGGSVRKSALSAV